MKSSLNRIFTTIFISSFLFSLAMADKLPLLKVSENKRFLVKEDGSPFFWLGDTAWELFHRLNREEAEAYLKDRAEKGFTVIQAVVLAELNGLHDPNAYGQKPFQNDDPAQPNEEYFKHVDWITNKAEELGLYIGMLPTWGDKWAGRNAEQKIFNPENAGRYGEWLANRYKEKPVIWILGGDRSVENEDQKKTICAMGLGLRKGDGGKHLITFHPTGGGQGSATWFHNEPWLDFNMLQNGHSGISNQHRYTVELYKLVPTKPVIDGEPIYEDHPLSFNAKENGHSIAADVRRALYWDLFTGAFGHTYGHHSIWQMYAPGRNPINGPLMPWFEAIKQPGASQMQYGRRLMESRPFLTRIPDDSIIVPHKVPTSVPGAGIKRFVATRDTDGAYAMVYAPIGRAFSVRMDVIRGKLVKAWWYNPRNGESLLIGEFPNTGTHEFLSPDPGEQIDWILVLDDALKNYPAPGQKK